MFEMDYADKLGAGIVAAGGIAATIWAWILRQRKEMASTSATVAIAESQQEVYSQMRERLSDLAAQLVRLTDDVDRLREQIRERDNKIHSLELYVSDLKYILHMKGIDIPQMRAST